MLSPSQVVPTPEIRTGPARYGLLEQVMPPLAVQKLPMFDHVVPEQVADGGNPV